MTDTLIRPPEDEIDHDAEASARKRVETAVRNAGLTGLRVISLVDGRVDEDGCQGAPISARLHWVTGQHSASVDAVADLLRAHGFRVTILSGDQLTRADSAEQKRLAALKTSDSLTLGSSEKRWFLSADERGRCVTTGLGPAEAPNAWKVKHPAMLRQMEALHQDAVVVIAEGSCESEGAKWNIILPDLILPKSSVELSGWLVLRDGSIPWSGKAFAEGELRPAVEQTALLRLKAYVEAELQKLEANPNSDPPKEEQLSDPILAGDLNRSPGGSTLGPSLWATRMAAAQRLYDQFGFTP